jgi:transposase-like protein
MSRSTISTFQLFEMFPTAESARLYLESRLWENGVTCPTCKATERITTRKGGFYRCNACQLDFTIRTGTIFERSHVPLHKWLYAMYLLVTARKGISSMQLAKEIGVTQKSAWFVLHRLREAWMTGQYYLADDEGTLQRIRNNFGPSWLVRFSLSKGARLG